MRILFRKGNVINSLYPFIIALIFVIAGFVVELFVCKIYMLKGFSDVLQSVIGFSSIIIGFYTAMYGILLAIQDSDIMKLFRKTEVNYIFKFQLYDSLISSFLILVFSIILQILSNYNSIVSTIFTYIWLLLLGYFLGTSFRAITLLLSIMFNYNKIKRASSSEIQTEEEKKQKYGRINKEK